MNAHPEARALPCLCLRVGGLDFNAPAQLLQDIADDEEANAGAIAA